MTEQVSHPVRPVHHPCGHHPVPQASTGLDRRPPPSRPQAPRPLRTPPGTAAAPRRRTWPSARPIHRAEARARRRRPRYLPASRYLRPLSRLAPPGLPATYRPGLV